MMEVLKYGKLEMDPAKLSESVTLKVPARKKTGLQESYGESSFLMPKIEAIHAGTTRNYTHYSAEKLRGDASLNSGVYSWLEPYGKPVIYNHDVETEVTGRVVRAAYAEYTKAGRPGIVVVPKITDPKAVQAIKDERLLTVSIGATSDAAICSICGTDIVNEGFCGHMKGESYNGITAEWITGNLWFDELSWVNVPADQTAQVVETETNMLFPEEADTSKESVQGQKQTLNEFYNVPAHTTVIEAVAKQKKEEAEELDLNENKEKDLEKDSKEKELDEIDSKEKELDEKDSKEKESALDESEKTEHQEDEHAKEDEKESDEKEDELEKDETEELDDKSDKESKEADEDQEEEEEEEDEEKPEAKPSTDEKESVNIALQAQNEALLAELREFYKKEILKKVEMEESAKEKFAERLNRRSLDSLKESLSDLEEGFFVPQMKQEEPKKRTVQKIESPIKTEESVSKNKKESSSDRVNFFVGLLNK